MAKKTKKRTTKKKTQRVAKARSSFWPMAGGILLLFVAFFLALGGFGTGGPLPVGLFSGAYAALGWVAYLSPLALACLGVWKFTDEDSRIPLSKMISTFAFIVFAAGLAHVAFANEDVLGKVTGGNGGAVGSLVGGIMLSALDTIPASILFFVLAVLMFFLTFSISPRVILDFINLFRGNPSKDTDIADLKAKSADDKPTFKLNEGVPVERYQPPAEPSTRHSSLKNTAAKLSTVEHHAALTAPNDPDWKFPGLDLLEKKQDKADAGDVEGNAEIIKDTFGNFNISVDMESANIGPRVTQFTLRPPTGVKLTKITALENNLMLDLGATSIRMEAPIPGKRAVGIEVPNKTSATVRLGNVLQTKEWYEIKSPLGFAIGRDISGKAVTAELDKMPHLLVAGQTGSGKSVMINTILTSLLYRNSPSDLKLILVDPKQVELKPYDDIPHLLAPVIVEPEKCISALKWTVAEMERRYKELSLAKVRNIVEYNKTNDEGMPYIVVVIDELADLMMMAARDVEALIVRIAQKARAVGIHLILATQRPSVDVITGLIKANVPARIAFTVASQVDSRTILDQMGAEKLLGQGDMLLSTANTPKPIRVQGAFIGDNETNKVTDFIRSQGAAQYNDEIISQPVQIGKGGVIPDGGGSDMDDPMYKEAVRAVIDGGKASTSLLQRRLRIGYGKAARFMETMEEQGIISAADGNRPREVLVSSPDDVFGDTATTGTAMDAVLDENFPEA